MTQNLKLHICHIKAIVYRRSVSFRSFWTLLIIDSRKRGFLPEFNFNFVPNLPQCDNNDARSAVIWLSWVCCPKSGGCTINSVKIFPVKGRLQSMRTASRQSNSNFIHSKKGTNKGFNNAEMVILQLDALLLKENWGCYYELAGSWRRRGGNIIFIYLHIY